MSTKDIEILKVISSALVDELYQFAPKLQGNMTDNAFWVHFNSILFDEGKTIEFLQNSGVKEVSHFLDKIRMLRKEYTSHLAAEYCNGASNPTVERLLNTNYKPFAEEVEFQGALKQALTISEREKLKRKLSLLTEAEKFDVSDAEIAAAFELQQKKSEHESIKQKMLEWSYIENDKNASTTVNPIDYEHSPSSKHSPKGRKTISISFIKYAAAACFIGVMTWLGIKFYNQPQENVIVVNHADTTKSLGDSFKEPKFAVVSDAKYQIQILKDDGIGFAKGKQKIEIVVHNTALRIASIEEYLDSPKKDSIEPNFRLLAKQELDSLRLLSSTYTFNGKSLSLYTERETYRVNAIIAGNKQFYLKSGDNYFYFDVADKPKKLRRVTDNQEKEQLERIYFDNEN
jgi:hypothetical protein